jgi:chemotaxis protein CheZ
MSNTTPLDNAGDSAELEALFESIASAPNLPPPVKEVPANDSAELESLFDSIAATSSTAAVPSAAGVAPAAVAQDAAGDAAPAQDKVFNRIGQMTRQLHDTLRELGYDKLLEETVHGAIPDARDRLSYIANLTEQAACRVLNATDIAQPVQDKLRADAAALGQAWDRVYANQASLDEFKQLAGATRVFVKNGVPGMVEQTNAQLMEIMMAQDFQDLTGQVIKKVVALAQQLESQLMAVLIDTIPGERRSQEVASLLNGPVVNADGRTDVVVSQEQVDDLLDSLGF